MVKKISVKSNKEKAKIYFIGDMHLGSKTFARKEFEELLDKISKEKDSGIVLMGDYGDFIESDDSRRYDSYNVDNKWNSAYKQYQAILKYFKPFADNKKILGILRGNHEAAYAKYHKEMFTKNARDYAEMLANEFKVPYLEDMGIIKFKIGRYSHNIVVCHGAGATASLNGQLSAISKILNSFEVQPEIIVMGHVHSLQTVVNPKMDFTFKTKTKYLAFSGNFYRTYIEGNINYASASLYNPLPVGCVAFEFTNKGIIKDEKVIL